MRKIEKKTILLYILIFGISFLVIGIILNIVFSSYFINKKIDLPIDPISKILFSYPPIFMLLTLLIIAPISEEFAFRFWINNKKSSKIVSFIAINFFVYSVFNSLIALGATTIVLGFIFFIYKNENYNLILMIFFTSLIFSLIHILNYNAIWIKIVAVIQLFGFALILSYIGIRFKFIYCIIAHSIFNFIAIIPFINLTTIEPIVFENSTFKADLTELSIFSFQNQTGYVEEDSILVFGNLPSIATSLVSYSNDFIYLSNTNNFNSYKLIVKSKKDKHIDKNELLNDYINKTKLHSDTLYKKAYILSYKDSTKFVVNKSDGYFLHTISTLIDNIRFMYKIPLVMDNGLENKIFSMKLDYLKIKTFEETKAYLKINFNIDIQASIKRNVAIVNFYD